MRRWKGLVAYSYEGKETADPEGSTRITTGTNGSFYEPDGTDEVSS